MLTPREVGLPEEFCEWRPHQADAVHFLQTSAKRVKALCAPTGSGKSATAITYALLDPNEPTAIVTESRALQHQYGKTYHSCGAVLLMGRNNYACHLREDYTCEEGYHARCPYKGSVQCPASQAEMRASSSSIVITNYSKWIRTRRFGQGLSHIKRLVLDEGHEAASALAQALQVILHHREIEETLGLDFPKSADSIEMKEWRVWAGVAREVANEEMMKVRALIVDSTQPKPSHVRHYNHMRNLTRKLGMIATANPDNWVVERYWDSHGKRGADGYQFDPVNPARYSESNLLLHVPSIVVMSATLRPKSLFMIGVKKADLEFREYPSEFDPTRCPIYHVPTMRVDARASTLSPLWIRFDQIAAMRRDRNGLCHTISYLRREEVEQASRFSDSMFFNPRGEPASPAIEDFRQHYPGAILVSPSIGQGFDFKGSEAEWQFVCKVPFPPPSKVMKARTQADPEYPYHLAAQKFQQMCGRIMRSSEDQGETFICDDHFQDWFRWKFGYLFTKAFKMFYKSVPYVPAPPPRLT
jgi:Rad3-related DNA helicase